MQETLETGLATVLRVPRLSATCAGRTDTGVHARAQVVHVDLDESDLVGSAGRAADAPYDALHRRLNGILPADVRVRRVAAAAPGFDARYSALWRRYAYRIADLPETVDPLTRGHVLVWPHHLDEAAMNESAALLLGVRDFAAFCKKRPGATTIRTLLDLRWQRGDDGVLVATVRADAFCHNMVRSLVGAMVAVGEHRQPPEWARAVMVAGVRDSSVRVIHAHGLTLEEVGYPSVEELAEQAIRSRARRTLPADAG